PADQGPPPFLLSLPPWATPFGDPALLRAMREHDDAHGLDQDGEIEEEIVVLHIIEVVSELLPRILDRLAIAVIHLRPAGDAGFDPVPEVIIGHFPAQLLDEIGALGPGADKAHIPFQHIDDLGNLVDPGGADEAAHPGDAIVPGGGPARHAILLGIGAHAAEFPHTEDAAVEAHPLLA